MIVDGAKVMVYFMGCAWLLFQVVLGSLMRAMLYKCYIEDLLSVLSLNKLMPEYELKMKSPL